MTTTALPNLVFDFKRNLALLNPNGSLGVELSANLPADVLLALQSNTPLPARDIDVTEVGVKASTQQPIDFARGADRVSFSASGSAFGGLGVYRSGAALLRKIGAGARDIALDGLEFGADGAPLAVLRWGYSVDATGSGAMALAPAGSATVAVAGSSEGFFAVIRRLAANTPARDAVQKTIDSWLLPRQIASVDQVEPGTWIVAEAIGGLSVTLHAQVGYDFNWVREATLAGLTGDIGLRLQMGLNAAIGFSASGRCAVVVSRDSDAKRLRLRLFRLRTRELDLSYDASLGIRSRDTLVPGKIDDFISAVFDTHGQQILRDLKVLDTWTDPAQSLPDLLAAAGIDGAERLIAGLAGVSPTDLQNRFDAVHSTVVSFIDRWHELPHTVASTLLKLVEERADLAPVRVLAAQLSTITSPQLATLLDATLTRVDFFHTPVGRVLESMADDGVLGLLEKPIGEIQDAGTKVSRVLDGSVIEDTLKAFQTFVESRLHLEHALEAATDTDFEALDALLKRKLAAFLGQQDVVLEDLEKVRKAVRLLLEKREEYYEKALQALHRKYNFTLNAAYQSATTDQALLDATFDFSHDPASVLAFFQQALRGNLDSLLEQQPAQVRLAAGTLSHRIQRQASVDITLPFLERSGSNISDALARVEAVPRDGSLLFTLGASDTVASDQRKAVLSVALALARMGTGAVRVHQRSLALNYSMLFAKRNMALRDVRAQIAPAVREYFQAKVPDVEPFLRTLDRQAEETIPNGAGVLGDGLVSLQLALSPACASAVGEAWLKAPRDRGADLYVNMSTAIQAALKKRVHDAVFARPDAYNSVATAHVVLAYCALVPTARNATGLSRFPFWDWADAAERRTMLGRPGTQARMRELLTQAQDVLRGDNHAGFFKPENGASILANVDANHMLLHAFLVAEADMIEHAVDAGVALASTLRAKPSEAVKALATFGAKLTDAFSADVVTLLGPGIHALGMRVLLAAAGALDPARAHDLADTNAMLSVELLKAGVAFDSAALLAAGHVAKEQLAFADRVVAIGLGRPGPGENPR